VLEPELDIVVYAVNADDTEQASRRARAVFEAAAARDLHLSLAQFPAALVCANLPGMTATTPAVTCLRSVLMKPEHADWVGRIVSILEDCAG
jgi:tyrosine decarboxylase / aspartate 1-decarboxylase